MNLGNLLNSMVSSSKNAIFEQGELAQLTYLAFDIAATHVLDADEPTVDVNIPVGYGADRRTMLSTRSYQKDELHRRYQFLASHQLSVNALVQLVTIMETMLGDVVRTVVVQYPQKLGAKKTIQLQAVLEATSLEEVHLRATDSLLNELSYKSPGEFAEHCNILLGINLLESPAFHRYVEVKASRDIFVHNRGVANEVYARKASSHARVRSGQRLPANTEYFLESYETCLQLAEWLEQELHNRWHSSVFEERKTAQLALPLSPPSDESSVDAADDADPDV